MDQELYFNEEANLSSIENHEIDVNISNSSFLSNIYGLNQPLLFMNLNDIESGNKNNGLGLNNFSRHNTECQTPSKVAANSYKVTIPPHFQIENINKSLGLEENQLQQYDDFLKLNNIKKKEAYTGKKRKRNEKNEEKKKIKKKRKEIQKIGEEGKKMILRFESITSIRMIILLKK